MQDDVVTTKRKKPLAALGIVKNFREVIEERDIHLLQKELYEFLHLFCGFQAHYDLCGFRATYSDPQDFADVFIRHFDSEHRLFHPCYAFHDAPYKDTGYSIAEIKREFARIVALHKESIANEATEQKRKALYETYRELCEIFEEENPISITCEACGETYQVTVTTVQGEVVSEFNPIFCLFCGQKLNPPRKEVIIDVEHPNTGALEAHPQII